MHLPSRGAGDQMIDIRELRSKFSELIDELDELSDSQQLHMLWWLSKESLFHLGILNKYIIDGAGYARQHKASCPLVRGTVHACGEGLNCRHPCDCGVL